MIQQLVRVALVAALSLGVVGTATLPAEARISGPTAAVVGIDGESFGCRPSEGMRTVVLPLPWIPCDPPWVTNPPWVTL